MLSLLALIASSISVFPSPLQIGATKQALPTVRRALPADHPDVLKGLNTLSASVENLSKEAIEDGLMKDVLTTAVELPLRQAGIRIVPLDDNGSPGPLLILRVTCVRQKTDASLYNFRVWLGLHETVRLERDPGTRIIGAITWETPVRWGTISATDLKSIPRYVGESIDKFVNAYLSANPKK